MTKPEIDRYARGRDAIADRPEEVSNLRMRSELIDKITALIQKNGWTQLEAARHCSVTRPLMNELRRGRIWRFFLDALVNIAAYLGQRVHVELLAA